MRKNSKSLIAAEWFARTNGLDWPEDDEMVPHEIVIQEVSEGNCCSVSLDGRQIDDVYGYKISRIPGCCHVVTITLRCDKVTINPDWE